MDQKAHLTGPLYHLIYKTTDLRNGKIYVGKHSTLNINDNYYGSGIIISSIIKKYGKKFLQKEILMFCESKEEMDSVEELLVDDSFINRVDTYNISRGGYGGYPAGSPESKVYVKKAAISRSGRTKETHQYLQDAAAKRSKTLKGRRIPDTSAKRKISQEETCEIVRRFIAGESRNSIMEDFGTRISIVTLNKILRDPKYGGNKELAIRKPKLTHEDINLVKQLNDAGECFNSIYAQFSDRVSSSTIYRILTTS